MTVTGNETALTPRMRAEWGDTGDGPAEVNTEIRDYVTGLVGRMLDGLGRSDRNTGYGYGAGLIAEFAEASTPAEFAAKLADLLLREADPEGFALLRETIQQGDGDVQEILAQVEYDKRRAQWAAEHGHDPEAFVRWARNVRADPEGSAMGIQVLDDVLSELVWGVPGANWASDLAGEGAR